MAAFDKSARKPDTKAQSAWEEFDKWARKPETKAQIASAKKNAWNQFIKQFPNADKTQFFVQTSVDERNRISAEVFF